MHEGGWEPFVHHFSSMLGDVVPQDEETRAVRAVRHHARLAGTAAVLEDVVPQDEETRVSDVLPVNRTMKKYKICGKRLMTGCYTHIKM